MRNIHLVAALALALSLCPPAATVAPAAERPERDAPETRPAPASVAELLRDRIATSEKAMNLAVMLYQNGQGSWDDVALWTQRWLQTRLDAAEGPEQRVALLRQYVKLAGEREQVVGQRMQAGITNQLEVESARFLRIDAELKLARAEAGLKDGGGAAKSGAGGRHGQGDRQALQGDWKLVRKVKNGAPDDADGPITMKFDGQTVTQSRGDEKSEGTFVLDESGTPRRITLTGTRGEKAGGVFEAIYELDGDTLKLAYGTGANAKTPPADFTGGPGTGLLVLERVKK